MPTQSIRRTNLRRVLDDLARNGYSTRESQAVYLGRSVTARRLDAMLNGAEIPAFFAAALEHALFKPRGWLSLPHDADQHESAGMVTLPGGPD